MTFNNNFGPLDNIVKYRFEDSAEKAKKLVEELGFYAKITKKRKNKQYNITIKNKKIFGIPYNKIGELDMTSLNHRIRQSKFELYDENAENLKNIFKKEFNPCLTITHYK